MPEVQEQALRQAFAGRRVLVTGHTGFKGSWLALWLDRLGAEVTGVALPPPGDRPNLFDSLRLCARVDHRIADLRTPDELAAVLDDVDPEVVFHLAAQPLVRLSYDIPAETFLTNVVGTARLLDFARSRPSVKAVIVVTSDKCYENVADSVWGYRESDPLGGSDPYSASKGCTELVVNAYRRSFFAADSGCTVASVRAGNVIGGGDWSEDRLLPDIMRAAFAQTPVLIRNPRSIRPWQHVLEPLTGYLQLAANLLREGHQWAGPWNFGPDRDGLVDVGSLLDEVRRCWPAALTIDSAREAGGRHEAHALRLDNSKAQTLLGWRPLLRLPQAVRLTVDWYRAHAAGADMAAFTLDQIDHYVGGSLMSEAAPISEAA